MDSLVFKLSLRQSHKTDQPSIEYQLKVQEIFELNEYLSFDIKFCFQSFRKYFGEYKFSFYRLKNVAKFDESNFETLKVSDV